MVSVTVAAALAGWPVRRLADDTDGLAGWPVTVGVVEVGVVQVRVFTLHTGAGWAW